MCRNIKPLFNFDPPATEEEIKDAATQFVRKVSGFQRPSHVNETIFDESIEDISKVIRRLVDTLSTSAAPKNREEEAHKAHLRAIERFGA